MAGEYSQTMGNIGNQVKGMQFTGEKPSFMLYLGLACIALLKDSLDLILVGSLPGIGTVVTLCFSFLIWILMTIFDRSGGKQNNKMARGLVLMLTSLVEAIGFGLNFLPIETFTVASLYIMARSAWKKEQKRLEKESQTQGNAERIRQYQMAQAAARMAQEAANNEVFQEEKSLPQYQGKEAVNDSRYRNKPVRKIS
jgi:hypothetical protein